MISFKSKNRMLKGVTLGATLAAQRLIVKSAIVRFTAVSTIQYSNQNQYEYEYQYHNKPAFPARRRSQRTITPFWERKRTI